MRIAIISDIHGNLPALEAVLADLGQADVDQVICLGDVAVFGPQPQEVIARLRELNCAAVMGNTDAWALEPRPHGMRDENTRRVYEIELWGARQLTSAGLDYLRTFQPTVEMSLGGGGERLLAYHGSPRSSVEVIVATTPDEELAGMLSGSRATVMAGGHTHQQMLRRYNEAALINPGSVGLPYERVTATGQVRHPPRAEYALAGWEDGVLSVDFRRVPFDVDLLIQTALESGMPHAGWWIQGWSRGHPV